MDAVNTCNNGEKTMSLKHWNDSKLMRISSGDMFILWNDKGK